jgi:serine/threonine protein kinase
LLSANSALFDRIDGRSDVFSLGLVLFKMLTGQNPLEMSRRLSQSTSPTPLARRVRSVAAFGTRNPAVDSMDFGKYRTKID